MTSFEEILERARNLPVPERSEQRAVEWCDSNRVVALARDVGGSYEIFIRSTELRPGLPIVRRHLKFDAWRVAEGSVFQANRLVLPAESHFLPVAALIVEELLRLGVAAEPDSAFAACEELIDMALRRTTLDEEATLGLLGELRFLGLLLAAAESPQHRAIALESWKGFERSSRDFVFAGGWSVEVKVTRSNRSIHQIHGIGQVDPSRDANGAPTEQLYLVSLGLEAADLGQAPDVVTLGSQVQEVLRQLGPNCGRGERNEVQELFVERLKHYGMGSDNGYVHDEMSLWPAYQVPWRMRFARAYNMNAPEVEVLRLADVRRRSFVAPGTVSFQVELPSIIGSDNPASDIGLLARRLVVGSSDADAVASALG